MRVLTSVYPSAAGEDLPELEAESEDGSGEQLAAYGQDLASALELHDPTRSMMLAMAEEDAESPSLYKEVGAVMVSRSPDGCSGSSTFSSSGTPIYEKLEDLRSTCCHHGEEECLSATAQNHWRKRKRKKRKKKKTLLLQAAAVTVLTAFAVFLFVAIALPALHFFRNFSLSQVEDSRSWEQARGPFRLSDGDDDGMVVFLDTGNSTSSAYYYLSASSAPFSSARRRCLRMGGRLAEVRSRAEHEALSARLALLRPAAWWLGATDQREEGQFRWMSDGEKVENRWALCARMELQRPVITRQRFHTKIVAATTTATITTVEAATEAF